MEFLENLKGVIGKINWAEPWHVERKTRHLRLNFKNKTKSIKAKLIYLYGEEKGREAYESLERIIITEKPKRKKRTKNFDQTQRFSEKDLFLITYPDSIHEKKSRPLHTLDKFCKKKLKGIIKNIHILPFYPYSSDRGFSVIDYRAVNPRFGIWKDLKKIDKDFDLMFDGIFNHASSKSEWFKEYLAGNPKYKDFFIEFKTKESITPYLKDIVRPRTSSLLTEFVKKGEKVYVWTTFSEDQIDLNYKNPEVLLEIIRIILFYVKHGARFIRIDAANYLWKELGTSCVNLKQTHTLVQLLRDILDITAPDVSILTETNVAHSENIRYFGNGKNEAQMVYNFSLPPLVLYSIYKGSSKYILRWADKLEKTSKYSTYLNFLASHDGIGLAPAKRVLPKKEAKFLIENAKKKGSLIQYKMTAKGEQPYELNTTWWNAINGDSSEDLEIQISRYIASRTIALSLKGVPGLYIHSLLGTANDVKKFNKTHINRDVNRKDLDYASVMKELSDKDSKSSKVFERITDILKIRTMHKAFHPNAEQKIISGNDSVFSIIRISSDKKERIYVLINLTGNEQNFRLDINTSRIYDLLSKIYLIDAPKRVNVKSINIRLNPYEVLWLEELI